jgi:prophage tail gpP-like protein
VTATTLDDDQIALVLADSGVRLTTWTSYTFNSHFLTPTDGFSFTVAHESLPATVDNAIVPGAKVQLLINDKPQCTGYIDKVGRSRSREGGTEIRIEGRDALSPAVDATMDPRVRFSKGQTLADVLQATLGPFGFTTFNTDDDDNRQKQTGRKHGTEKAAGKKKLAAIQLHQLKPYPKEGLFAFVHRIANRHGLWVWCSGDGESVVASTPDYVTPPIATLVRKPNASNILMGEATFSVGEQPSGIVAQGFGGGGEFARSRLTAYAVNPAVSLPAGSTPTLQQIKTAYPEAVDAYDGANPFSGFATMVTRWPRLTFMHDDEAKTVDELKAFVRRELSLKLRESLEYRCTVRGHTFVDKEGTRVPWCVNTMVQVEDAIGKVHEPLWVLSRTFTKSRGSGTLTTLELTRPYTMVF